MQLHGFWQCELDGREMTISRRIFLGYVAILALVIALVVVGAVVLVPLRKDIKEYSSSVLAQADAASRTALTAKAMGTNGATGVIGSSSDRSNAVSQLEVKRREAMAALDQAEALVNARPDKGKAGSLAQIGTLRTLVDQYNSVILSALSLSVTNQDAARARLTSEVFPLGERVDAAASAYYEQERTQTLAQANRLSGRADAMWIVLCAMSGIVVAGGLALGITVPRTVSRNLRAALEGVERSADQMLSIASQVALGTAETSVATNETATTVEEVRQTAFLSQERAAKLAENSEHVARIAEAGRAQARGTIRAYEHIESQVAVVAEAIGCLRDQTRTAGDIIATVNDLAEQSNVLSMNASIEAARAGEHGKGFSVVAEEVKSLAQQSKRAVGQISSIVNEIEKAGAVAVKAAEQGKKAIEAGRIEVVQAEAGTLSLTDAAGETAESAVTISASSRQQLVGMEQISRAMGSINHAGNQSAQGTRRIEEDVRELQGLALRLRRLVERQSRRSHSEQERPSELEHLGLRGELLKDPS